MKKLLIISPYFVPANTADMQRVRISVPYFKENGWDATVVAVDEHYVNVIKDELFTGALPADVRVIKIKASSKSWTSRIGIGSIGLRSYSFYRKEVDALLTREHFDLIYFSTTQFPVCALGSHWKRKFKIPYVIDMQDPWYTTTHSKKNSRKQSLKQRLMYALHKRLERIAMDKVDGLIAVSTDYITALKNQYISLANVPSSVITFGAFEPDIKIAEANQHLFKPILGTSDINIVYIGRGGTDMHKAVIPVFKALKQGMQNAPEQFAKLKLYFIGTSYAPNGKGTQTIIPLAVEYGVDKQVIEITNRISYYHTLITLQQADAVLVPGSDAAHYTASKIYPYLLTHKPLLAIFHKQSSVVDILNKCTTHANVFTFDNNSLVNVDDIVTVLQDCAQGKLKPVELNSNFDKYFAGYLTGLQTRLFTEAVEYYKTQCG